MVSYAKHTFSGQAEPFLWKLPFCISSCSETSPSKYDLVTFLHPKSPNKCHKNFENRLTNKTFTVKNNLD